MHQTSSGRFISVLVAGIVCGFLSVVVTIGHGSLLFSGDLQGLMPAALGLALFSTTVMTIFAVLGGSKSDIIPIAQEIPIVAMVSIVSAVAAAIDPSLPVEARAATIFAAVAVTTMATALVTLILGYCRLGGLIRFTPYPVIAGFLTGTGWLILLGGISVTTNQTPSFALLPQLLHAPLMLQVGLMVALVAVLFATERMFKTPFAVPAVLLAVLVAFNLAVWIQGNGYEPFRAGGWLIRMPEAGKFWPPVELSALTSVDWSAVARGMLTLPIVIVITIVALLMNTTGIELHADRDLDLNQEMRSNGLMNLLVGAGGGLPGYSAVSLTLIIHQLHANSRWVGVIVVAMTISALFLGSVLLDAVPAILLGAVLVWVGGSLMYDWLVRARRRLDPFEYGVILLIALVIVLVSFPIGILVGLIAAIFLFAFQYGRVDIVRHELTGADWHTSGDVSGERHELLRQHGAGIVIVRLQGFLFFGTADRLRKRVQDRMEGGGRFLLIDFQRVSGMDSSAVQSFIRLSQVAAKREFTVILTGLAERPRQALIRNGLKIGEGSPVRIEPDLERGLRWCEDSLLSQLGAGLGPANGWTLHSLLQAFLKQETLANTVASYCQRLDIAPGDPLIVQGGASSDMFFIESGTATVEMAGGGGTPVALATVGPGDAVGEISFYLRERRSASIVAREALVVWCFSRDDLERLAADLPEAAVGFHTAMAALLSRRLAVTNRLVGFLAN
ncbi:SulP family inorganic anion transporter [Kaistia defluvii]|uniref:SLC26A/SulP transporter family protein n=1 Tax=Kaistia defluvii TaxID=410841 RepID=UPI0022536E57|nr:SulP family inorganic anion transporter [Kaistia defluvii]MCX5519547.1 SulP family inorganic anion transporter [Kaistia defluvii]